MTRWGNGRGGRPWRRLRDQVLARDHYTCQRCGRISDTDMECDHIVPTSKGGTDEPSNLQALCRDCHKAKTTREAGGNPRQAVGVDGWPVARHR